MLDGIVAGIATVQMRVIGYYDLYTVCCGRLQMSQVSDGADGLDNGETRSQGRVGGTEQHSPEEVEYV